MAYPVKSAMTFRHYQKIMRVILMVWLFIYAVGGLLKHENFSFINGVNLLLHEGGHVLFGYVGEYPGIWGGTLMQLMIPLLFANIFIKMRDFFSASVMIAWAGQSMINISDYMKDARTQVLPYVGGEIHDWHYIFSRAGLLEKDVLIGSLVGTAGAVLMLLMLGTGMLAVILDLIGTKEKAES